MFYKSAFNPTFAAYLCAVPIPGQARQHSAAGPFFLSNRKKPGLCNTL